MRIIRVDPRPDNRDTEPLVHSDEELARLYGEEYVRVRHEAAGLLEQAALSLGVPVARMA